MAYCTEGWFSKQHPSHLQSKLVRFSGLVKAMKRVSKELDVIMESWVEDHKKKECHRFLLNVKTLCVHPFYKSLHLILVACSVKETLQLLSGDKLFIDTKLTSN
ncbi:hypothetical protein LINPERHAP1_LOCUS35003 [Linum perenne]